MYNNKVTPAKKKTATIIKKHYYIWHIVVIIVKYNVTKLVSDSETGMEENLSIPSLHKIQVVGKVYLMVVERHSELEWSSNQTMARVTATRGHVSSLLGGTSCTHSPHPWL